MNGPARRGARALPVIAALLMLGALAAVVGACVALLPGSSFYRPISDLERAAERTSSRDIFPLDVPAGGRSPRDVAWVGVLRALDIVDEGANGHQVRLLVEHRHYDWIEDRGAQRERHFVSPRGEGVFASRFRLAPGSRSSFKERVRVGDLFIVYGPAHRDAEGSLFVDPSTYTRAIPAGLWRDDVFDYGRPGTPIVHLSTALPGVPTRRAPPSASVLPRDLAFRFPPAPAL